MTTFSEDERNLVRSYWRKKSLLRLAIEHPDVVLKQEAAIIDTVVELAHATADAWLLLEEQRRKTEE